MRDSKATKIAGFSQNCTYVFLEVLISLQRTFHPIACNHTVMNVMHLSDNFFTARALGGERHAKTLQTCEKCEKHKISK